MHRYGPLQVHREGDGGDALVVLLHGFGAPGDDLVPLAPLVDAPPGTVFAFPEAPLELPPPYALGNARAWWMIDLAAVERALAAGQPRALADEVPEGLADARAAVVEALDAMQADLGIPPERTVLGGFSQGAMLSVDVALHTDRPFAGLVVLSGNLLAAREWTPRMPARAGLPVFQSHGEHDPLLPFAGAEALRDALRDAGVPVEWVAFPGGHEIGAPALDGASAFVRRVLGAR